MRHLLAAWFGALRLAFLGLFPALGLGSASPVHLAYSVPQAASSLARQTPPSASQDARRRTAMRIFAKRCAECHGNDGKGNEMRNQMQQLPNFADPDWHRPRDDRQLLVSILDGKGTRMPAFRDKLAREEAELLVGHVRSFGRKNGGMPPSAQQSLDDFDRRFAELQEELGELKRQFREARPEPPPDD